jgi:peptidoglycan hydrolase-like protein with peptidoglycan-binding domain
MARPLIKVGSSGDDVLDAILRLNLGGANPQLVPGDTFDAAVEAAAKDFQVRHGLQVDGQIGTNTWDLLDQLEGGRLLAAADVDAVRTARDQARVQLGIGDFAGAKATLDPIYAQSNVPPEVRASVVANLGWAEHGLGNTDRALGLYLEHLAILNLMGGVPLVARDVISRLRDLNLGAGPSLLPSDQNKANLPPDG